MKFFKHYIVNFTALRRPYYVFRITSFRQSTLTLEQFPFYSISVMHSTLLTTTAYFIHHTSGSTDQEAWSDFQLDSKRSSIDNNNNWGLCDQKVSQAGINNYIQQSTVGCNYLSLPEIPEKSALRISCYTRWLKNTYELLNLRTLKYLPVNKIYIFQCIGKIFCV